MLRSQILLLLLDIVTTILVVGILVTGYFTIDRSGSRYGYHPRHDPKDSCQPHADGGLPHTGCIRLVLIKPTEDEHAFVMTTGVFSLSAAPAYRALSYTWGFARGVPEYEDPVFPYKGQGGVPTSMPKNLLQALLRIAKLDEGAYYWIDSICIVQQNTRERNEQVSIMKQIYERAEAVDVWLGPATDSEVEAIDRVLGDLTAMTQKYGTTWSTETGPSRRFGTWLTYNVLPDEDWKTLNSFLSRRWFHRLWTLQEFALAKKVRIMHGDHFINPDHLHNAVLFLHALGVPMNLEYGNSGFSGTAIMQQSILRACLDDVNQLKEFVSQVPGLASGERNAPNYESVLAWVFWRSAATYATDPRDFIFGILGLAEAIMERLSNTTDDTGSSISTYNPLVPDYGLSTADVFRAFILRLMHSNLGIRAVILITPGVQTGEKPGYEFQRRSVPSWVDVKHELPSWIPNLANREQFPLSSGEALIPNRSKNSFNIHGSALTVQTQRFHIKGNSLHVFGRRLGVSRGSGRFPSAYEGTPYLNFLWNLFWPLSLLAPTYPTRCTDNNLSSKQLSPAGALLSCLSLGSWRPGSELRSFIGPWLPVWLMERFIVDGIFQYLCVELATDSGNKTIDSILTEDTLMSRALSIHGINKKYIYNVYKNWKKPLRLFAKHDFRRCIQANEDETAFFAMYAHFINQFQWARSRRVFALELDDEYASRLCTYSGVSNQQEATNILLGLGPETMKYEDEIWVIQGSEWPFLLRPRYIDKEKKLPVMDVPFKEKIGGWWSQTGKSARPIKVYELIGEAYVHGIMHGELFDDKQDLSDFEEIVIR